MLLLSFVTTLFLSFPLSAAQSPIVTHKGSPSWAFGVGFGVESLYKTVSVIEVKTPRLFQWGHSNVALVLSMESKNLAANMNKGISPIHMLFDFSYEPFREIVKSYFRLGGGSVLVSDETILVGQEQFFNFQVQLGAEVITFQGHDSSHGAFFVQVMLNSAAIRQPPIGGLDIFGGNSIVAGVRTYF